MSVVLEGSEESPETPERPYAPGCGPLGYCPALYGRAVPGPTPGRTRRIGLPERLCAWVENGEPCGQPVSGIRAKFCDHHIRASRREKTRLRVAGLRKRRQVARGNADSPPLALVK